MSGILNSLQGIAASLATTFQNVLNRVLSPEQREEIWARLQQFAINNPKLAAFLLTQIALTGFPLFLFITFTVTVFLFALIAALLIGVLVAVLFTVFMVGVALLVILPTIFITTFSATFLFLWGLGGYYILKWLNHGKVPAPDGTAIGDKLNSLTGGRMGWLMDGTRKKAEDASTGVDQTPKIHGSERNGNATKEKKRDQNGSAKKEKESEDGDAPDVGKAASTAKETASKQSEGLQKRPAKLTGSATNGTGTTKSAVNGATG
ncbi:hypothetical protein K505DRAFT_286014 [Melanomma pulvis-pyrius CBS 109.77]|uniref:Uncharacterized protein n=1 Tax=Melanomma pulvis-pyrius CBS 109.77 TaxID=1314802 RepID=A0A6A6WW97_9PLEO|nr:hypothetical protein K505DRAFT_286014 [Melanomma pulvis-pyrius CBS 109.77]